MTVLKKITAQAVQIQMLMGGLDAVHAMHRNSINAGFGGIARTTMVKAKLPLPTLLLSKSTSGNPSLLNFAVLRALVNVVAPVLKWAIPVTTKCNKSRDKECLFASLLMPLKVSERVNQ